jgi:hypothetical protein
MGNFFKELADIEEVVLVKKYYVTPVGESITYTDSTQRLLLKLIRFVQEGRYVSSSTAQPLYAEIFVCHLYSLPRLGTWRIMPRSLPTLLGHKSAHLAVSITSCLAVVSIMRL